MGISIFAFIIVLGVLIFVHELGHFLVARLFGVGVEKFSLGFGPKIYGKKVGITEYRISAIPLGGYVKMIGEEPDKEIEPEKIPLSFTHKHVFKRILIVAAGPFFNFLLALIIFYGFLQIYGTFIVKPTIGNVQDGKPAKVAGLKNGDQIRAVNGIHVDTWNEMAEKITASNGKMLTIGVRRDSEDFTVQIQPEKISDKNIFGETIDRYIIGITASGDVISKRLNPIEALKGSLIQTYEVTELMIIGIVKLIKGDISPKNIGGPILIAQMAGNQAKEGASNLIYFIAFISINLAIINFLPIPVLDGGHLLFFSIEAIFRRPVSPKIREVAQQAGLFILIMLMILVFYNDLTRGTGLFK